MIQSAQQIQVEFPGGEKIKAKTLASAAYADVALLKLERVPSRPSFAKLGDSDRVRVGEEIFIVGAPLGISHTLTVGHISARREADSLPGMFLKAELLQTDAAINHGNSGGPMFNMAGEVIGVVSSMLSRSGGYEGLGFVITSNLARRLVVDARTPWSGFEGFLLEGDLARAFNLPQSAGVLVQRVAEGSPAERAGREDPPGRSAAREADRSGSRSRPEPLTGMPARPAPHRRPLLVPHQRDLVRHLGAQDVVGDG